MKRTWCPNVSLRIFASSRLCVKFCVQTDQFTPSRQVAKERKIRHPDSEASFT